MLKWNSLRPILLLILLGFFISSLGFAQEAVGKERIMKPGVLGDASIGFSPIFLGNTANGSQFGGSVNMQIYLAKWFSLDADLAFSKNYVHLGPGTIALPVWMVMMLTGPGDGVDLNRESISMAFFVAAITIMSLEHFSIHIPTGPKSDLSPYMSLLRFRSSYPLEVSLPGTRTYDQFCFATGVKLDNYLGRFLVSPFMEYNIGYKDHISGFIGGLTCSYGFYLGGR